MTEERTPREQTHDRLSADDQHTACPDDFPAHVRTGRGPSWRVVLIALAIIAALLGWGLLRAAQ